MRCRPPTTCSATASAASGSTSTPSPISSPWSPPCPRSPWRRGSASRRSYPRRATGSPQRRPARPPARREALHRIRLIKDWDELEKINAAYELCWLGQEAVARGAVPGATEIELFTAAQSTAQLASGGPIEFLCDLLSGPNSADVCCPIHVAGTRIVEDGDPVIADVVVRANGYWGDTAETHVAGSNADAQAARSILLDILEQSRTELRPGATGAEVFANIHSSVVASFPDGELPHHGGHALGLTSFEDPHVIPSDSMPFEPWMALAIEPGVYFPGRYGARVENIFVVTPAGGVELRALMAGAA